MRYGQQKPELYTRIFECLTHIFGEEGVDNENPLQPIVMMLENKGQARRFAKDLNGKHKTFVAKLEDIYSYLEPSIAPEVASKLLAYSREVQIGKVIEVIGAKDERGKVRAILNLIARYGYFP